jgi:hypothetical protein
MASVCTWTQVLRGFGFSALDMPTYSLLIPGIYQTPLLHFSGQHLLAFIRFSTLLYTPVYRRSLPVFQ